MGRLSPAARRTGRIAAAIAFVSLVAACSRPQTPPKPPPPPAAPAPPEPPDQSAANPVLTRADLIDAADAARDAYARGVPYPAANADLIGRRLTLKLPFGCGDAASAGATATVQIDDRQRTLAITAQPQDWTKAAWVAAVVGQDPSVEDVEGFWIRRPWTTSETCPSAPAAPQAAPPAPAGPRSAAVGSPAPAAPTSAPPPSVSAETLGLARIYRAGDSRLKRHARHPYRVVLKLSDDRLPLDRRFWLVLDGRVASLDGGKGKGQPIRCFAANADTRPTCIVGLELDRVSVQAQATGETLAHWAG